MQKIKHLYIRTKSITKVATGYLKKRPKSQLMSFSIALATLILLALTILVSHGNNNKIAIVDTHKIISDFTNSISENAHITDHQKIALVKHFGVIYPSLLSQYSNAQHALILDKAVILQAPDHIADITPYIEKKVAENSVHYLKSLPANNDSDNTENTGEKDDAQNR